MAARKLSLVQRKPQSSNRKVLANATAASFRGASMVMGSVFMVLNLLWGAVGLYGHCFGWAAGGEGFGQSCCFHDGLLYEQSGVVEPQAATAFTAFSAANSLNTSVMSRSSRKAVSRRLQSSCGPSAMAKAGSSRWRPVTSWVTVATW